MENVPNLVNIEDNTKIPITSNTFTVGRNSSCQLYIPLISVSRYHCSFNKTDTKWVIQDMSSNGTYVNGKLYKFQETCDLTNADLIELGPEGPSYRFLLPEPPPPAPLASEEDDDEEFSCSICSEVFLKAVTLNCSHSFCDYCIEKWRSTKSTCPICRKQITSCAPTIVLDNFIEKMFSKRSEAERERRKVLLEQRTKESSSKVISLCSQDEDEDEDLEEEEENLDEIYEEEEWYERGFYGGYGACYSCGEPGHWANSCPSRRHRY